MGASKLNSTNSLDEVVSSIICPTKLRVFLANETAEFIAARPLGFNYSTKQELRVDNSGFWQGVPQHWMKDWETPFPIYIENANGVKIKDIDGNELIDMCLGDTGAMFGHSPEPILNACFELKNCGLTAMLPSASCDFVGAKLAEIFGLPFWQLALSASDANRFALRVARLVTGRQKILVFDGCYHGAVDETAVMISKNEVTSAKPSLWGSAFDPAINTICIPFNDIELLEAELSRNEIACIIMEPALTNCGIVPPKEGFLDQVGAIAKKYGTLLLIDETHTISTGLGGYSKVFDLKPDIFVAGKAVAGGIPCAIWGFTQDVKNNLEQIRQSLPNGHSGVGTTLGGSLLQINALKASLEHVMTAQNYDIMISRAEYIENNLNKLITEFTLNWSIIRIGARLEILFSDKIPQNAEQMREIFNHEIEKALHLGLINRGFLVTPFHNMLLAGPQLTTKDIDDYILAMRDIISKININNKTPQGET